MRSYPMHTRRLLAAVNSHVVARGRPIHEAKSLLCQTVRETALYAVAMVAVSWPVYRYLARK